MLVYYLIAGTVIMLALALARRKRFRISALAAVISALLLSASGVAGAMLMYFIESGRWGGTSLFGAVFFAPAIMATSALVFRINPLVMLDFITCEIGAMLTVLKLHCYMAECCGGRTVALGRTQFTFPSQLAECVVFYLITLVILNIEAREPFGRRVYFLFLAVYGAVRLILNSLRDGLSPFVLGIPAGHFWAIVSLAAGTAVFVFIGIKRKKRAMSENTVL